VSVSNKLIRYRLALACCFGLLVAGLWLPASAQKTQPDAAAYTLGPEDVIAVIVQRHQDYSGEFPVAPDGTVDLPGAGKMQAAGKTIAELTTKITASLATRLREPEVTVTLRTPRLQHIYVLGAVKQPGTFELKGTWHVTEALAAAGGMVAVAGSEQTPDPHDCTVTLLSANGKQQHWTLAEILAAKAGTSPELKVGDVLTVDVLQLLPVYVMGAVLHPGLCEIRPGQGVIEALALAGGLALPQGDVRVTLLRDKVNRLLDLHAVDPLPLQRGDVLTIDPLRALHVTVTGQVAHPGVYDLKLGEGVLTALTLAGGATPQAALRHVTVIHVSGKRDEIDVTPTMKTAGGEATVTLATGDMVVVPQNTQSVAVLGYVGHPGYYPLPEDKNWRLTEVLGLASGTPGKIAGLTRVALLRTDAAGKQTRQVVDVEKYFKKGDLSGNPPVQSGDVVFVPQSSTPDWGLIFEAITSYAVLRSATK